MQYVKMTTNIDKATVLKLLKVAGAFSIVIWM
jgi:hypothetical protein